MKPMRYENIPYRRWRKLARGGYHLVQTGASRRVLKRIMDATKQGKSIEFRHEITNSDFRIYDTISATIED